MVQVQEWSHTKLVRCHRGRRTLHQRRLSPAPRVRRHDLTMRRLWALHLTGVGTRCCVRLVGSNYGTKNQSGAISMDMVEGCRTSCQMADGSSRGTCRPNGLCRYENPNSSGIAHNGFLHGPRPGSSFHHFGLTCFCCDSVSTHRSPRDSCPSGMVCNRGWRHSCGWDSARIR